MTQKTLKITALTVAETARVLSSSYGRRITEAQVRDIAERGDLIADDLSAGQAGGTINLLEYTAFLVRAMPTGRQELAHGTD